MAPGVSRVRRLGQEPAQRRGRPPVPAPEQPHEGGDEQHADDRRVDDHRDGLAERDLLHEEDFRGAEREEHDRQQRGRGRDHAARALDAERDRLGVGQPAVAVLLDPREHEDRVVGRQAEVVAPITTSSDVSSADGPS